jgi:hypothetical protein
MSCHYHSHMGDFAQTLDAFRGFADDATLDPASLEIRRSALVHGMPAAYIARSLGPVKKTPCSTSLVEQGHGSGAVIIKPHALTGELLLRARATVRSCRARVQQSVCQHQVDRLEKIHEHFPKHSYTKASP